MQSIGVHFERMVTDDPEFGAARANTNFADYHHELRANVNRSIEFMRRVRPGSVFNRGPKPVEILKPTGSALGEPAPAKHPSPALPFPVRADGRENFPLQRDRGFRP